MKSRILCFILALAVVSNGAIAVDQETRCLNKDCVTTALAGTLVAGGIALWVAAIVGGAVMIGVSSAPQGDFNQEYSCGPGQLSSCCVAALANNQIVGQNCTLNDAPNTRCDGKTLFCAGPSSGLVQAPYVLQKWAKDTQIAGAVIFSVSATAAIFTGLVGLFC